MPLYEYTCRTCAHQFEQLSRSGQAPTCPACGALDLEKQLSVFAVSAGSDVGGRAMSGGGPCGTCGDPRGPGSCSVN